MIEILNVLVKMSNERQISFVVLSLPYHFKCVASVKLMYHYHISLEDRRLDRKRLDPRLKPHWSAVREEREEEYFARKKVRSFWAPKSNCHA